MKQSIRFKYFVGIIALLIVLAATTFFVGYQRIRSTMEHQYQQLNYQTVHSVAELLSIRLNGIAATGSALAYNGSVVSLLQLRSDSTKSATASQLRTSVSNLLSSYNWSQEHRDIMFDAYIIGLDGHVYSSFYPDKYTLDDIQTSDWYVELMADPDEPLFIGTTRDPEGLGASRYQFQVAYAIYDHLTDRPLGVLLMNVSEKVLYDSYASAQTDNNLLFLTNEDNVIISAKDKRLIGLTIDQAGNLSGNVPPSFIDEPTYETIEVPVGQLGWKLGQRRLLNTPMTPKGILNPASLFLNPTTLLVLAAVVALMIISTRMLTGYFSRPILALNEKMQQASHGDLLVRAQVQSNDEVGQLSSTFNQMIENTQKLIDEIHTANALRCQADLNFLRAQINPHFIHNTLDSIRFLIEMDKSDQAQEMLRVFNKQLRRTLGTSDEMVRLEEEMDAIRNYVQLQRLRYAGSFEVTYLVDDDIHDVTIPSFILQPIVENAIFYGIDKSAETTRIDIHAYRTDAQTLHIEVRDNGRGMSQEKATEIIHHKGQMCSIGVSNVHERIQMICGESYGLRVESEVDRGTTVLFVLPL